MPPPPEPTGARAVEAAGRPRLALAVAVAGVVVAADQATKWWALRALDDGPVDLGILDLRLTFNSGAAFGLGKGFAPVLVVAAVVLLVVLLRRGWLVAGRAPAVAAGLVLGGAVGNLLDRLFRDPGLLRGDVVDFVDLRWWPVFNLADGAIVVGAAVLVVAGGIAERRAASGGA